VTTEEVVDGDVPLAREFEPAFLLTLVSNAHKLIAGNRVDRDSPIAGIPPVRVEVTVGETSDLSKCTQEVLENDKKHEQESNHERKQEHADCFRHGEGHLCEVI